MFSLSILAFVQSLTEFLPVSSSGHLYLMRFLGISEQGLGLDVLLHLGTLIAVLWYFRQEVLELLLSLFPRQDKKLLFQLIVATLPVVIFGYFCFHWVDQFRLPIFVAINSIFWGIVLWLVDKCCMNRKTIRQMGYGGALLIGCAQVLSLIPGTSRSGITITCARLLGINRVESARFSMLLSIPTILGAVGYVWYQGQFGAIEMPDLSTGIWAIGLTMLFGILAILFLMKWVQKSSFAIFAIYRVLLGLFVLIYIIR